MRRMLLVLFIVSIFQVLTSAAICPQGDLTGDCTVSWLDLVDFAKQWLDLNECEDDSPCANFDGLNGIDFVDFAVLANHWLEGMPLVINEFMASNNSASGIHDPQGEFDDWIEIYNFGDEAIDLAGMYLTDDLNDPMKWQILAGLSIESGGYKIFWVDDDGTQGPTHTNFKLSIEGEQIGLFDTDGVTLIDAKYFGRQTTDISYGRSEDGSETWEFMSCPTPGWSNFIPSELDLNGDCAVNLEDFTNFSSHWLKDNIPTGTMVFDYNEQKSKQVFDHNDTKYRTKYKNVTKSKLQWILEK